MPCWWCLRRGTEGFGFVYSGITLERSYFPRGTQVSEVIQVSPCACTTECGKVIAESKDFRSVVSVVRSRGES